MLPQIIVQNLSKKYQIGKRQRYLTLRDNLSNLIKNPKDSLFGSDDESRDFWALRDINFTILPGEVVGIIGPNGAGKSTMLKILSRITYPTTGLVKLQGRVSSLLEVGTGFNQELTGRENIFLNGAILGMRQKEIKKKFDEIVDFSGIEKFLDTPVKHYSSGMYVRLAFAVAAHLDSDIMMVDEVLAVGDSEFQKKSLGKMKSVSQSGRTIFFVSHNTGAISQLCNRCLLFEQGKLIEDSVDVNEVINKYAKLSTTVTVSSEWLADSKSKKPFILRVAVTDKTGDSLLPVVAGGDDAFVTIDVLLESKDADLSIGYALTAENGPLMYWSNPIYPGNKRKKFRVMSQLPGILTEGRYRLEIIAMDGPRQWLLPPGKGNPSVNFEIHESLADPVFGAFKRQGVLIPSNTWTISDSIEKFPRQ